MDMHDIDVVCELLIKAGEEDQRVRKEKDIASWSDVDKQNLSLLKQVISIHGWPKRSLVGDVAEKAAWAIAQHTVSDIPFMTDVLKMRQALPLEEIAPQTNLLLEDRILVNTEGLQKFGTQIKGSPAIGFKPFPIQGIDLNRLLAGDDHEMQVIDARRAAVGLGPYQEYLAFFKIEPGKVIMPTMQR